MPHRFKWKQKWYSISTTGQLFSHKSRSKSRLPNKPLRTRFAPSPTGYLHLGGLRTALYNYLAAKATGGQFLLRIEDTDQSRLVHDAEESMFRDLAWAGLSWDEGPDRGGALGPYRQSERLRLYHKYATQLLNSGHAFRCFCTSEELLEHQQRCIELNHTMVYPGFCQAIPPQESNERAARGEIYTIRFKAPTSGPAPAFHDIVFGNFSRNEPQDSRILIKSDGFPTYHFANVIDDHLMGITHVIRGAEWLVSTPFHILLYKAFGWEHPNFCHVCLLTDMNRQKLSKRSHDIAISSYRDKGILPLALLNFCALAGWYPGQGSDVMTLPEMVERFSFKFTKGDAMVDFAKLSHFQSSHIVLAGAMNPPQKNMLELSFTRPVLNLISVFTLQGEIVMPADGAFNRSKHAQKPRSLRLGELMFTENELEDRLFSILRNNSQPYNNPIHFLYRHAYLIWRIPQHKLLWEYENFKETFSYIRQVSIDKNGKELYDEVTILEVLEVFKARLESLSSCAWEISDKQEICSRVLKEIVGQYRFMKRDSYPDRTMLSWKLLRWVLNGSTEGPTIQEMLLLLGRDECLRRFEDAIKVASWDTIK